MIASPFGYLFAGMLALSAAGAIALAVDAARKLTRAIRRGHTTRRQP